MTFKEIKQQDESFILHSYGRVDVAIESGKGVYATDAEGKKYIDFTSGIGVNALGYCPDNWVQAVSNQAAKLQHISNYYYNEKNTSLAEHLTKSAGLGRCFFCNSGAEANECAIKIARKAGEAKGKSKIITLIDSFHGRTITTLAATGQDAFHQLFRPLTDGFIYVPAGDIEALKEAVDDSVCGIMIECVQGEGGVIPMKDTYLKAVRALCDEKDIAMIVDEVQTGVGRTGWFYSYQSAEITPDIVTTAKGLGGGLPIGVCMVRESLKDIFAPGMNGSTFGGNPVVCAGALEIVKTIDDQDFLDSVKEKGEYFRQKLLEIPGVEFVRGKGLMLGISVEEKTTKEILLACAEKGLLVLTAKSLVRFLPPLNITKDEIDAGLKIFAQAIKTEEN